MIKRSILGEMPMNQVVKVKREKIAACMTCLICSKLLREATAISECLHTFCRKCIYTKILDEEVESCPTCNIDFGCTPLKKLRPDHNMQDVRAKIFPFKRRKVDPPESIPSVSLPARRKERSLSSLMVNMPRVSTKASSMTGRRTKAVARKTNILHGCGFIVEKPIKKELEDHRESSSSRDSLQKFSATKLSSALNEEPQISGVHQWKPLNYLGEVANRTNKSHKLNSKGFINKSLYDEGLVRKTKIKDESNDIDEENLLSPPRPSSTGVNITQCPSEIHTEQLWTPPFLAGTNPITSESSLSDPIVACALTEALYLPKDMQHYRTKSLEELKQEFCTHLGLASVVSEVLYRRASTLQSSLADAVKANRELLEQVSGLKRENSRLNGLLALSKQDLMNLTFERDEAVRKLSLISEELANTKFEKEKLQTEVADFPQRLDQERNETMDEVIAEPCCLGSSFSTFSRRVPLHAGEGGIDS